jgi:hypothetical protein
MKRTSPLQMADDIRYTTYPSYRPYASYDPYASAVDEAAAKADAQKRHEMKIEPTELNENVKREETVDTAEPGQKSYGTYE